MRVHKPIMMFWIKNHQIIEYLSDEWKSVERNPHWTAIEKLEQNFCLHVLIQIKYMCIDIVLLITPNNSSGIS